MRGAIGSVVKLPDVDRLRIVTKECPFCHTHHTIDVDAESFYRWQNDTKIQDAFPDMTADMRELLISGTDPVCWDKFVADDD